MINYNYFEIRIHRDSEAEFKESLKTCSKVELFTLQLLLLNLHFIKKINIPINRYSGKLFRPTMG